MVPENDKARDIFKHINVLLKEITGLYENNTGDLLEQVENLNIEELILTIKEYAKTKKPIFKKMHFLEEILSVEASWENIKWLVIKNENERAFIKLKYELLPLIENMRMDYYYNTWICLDNEKRKQYFEKEVYDYYRNPYVEQAKITGNYKYDLSIIVTGYNKLEYTQICIQSLMNHLPKNLKYEIILVNHGSTDGTREYFEGLMPNKQIDIKVNGGGYDILDRIVEGRYVLRISNDVVVTDNAIKNLYKCIKSDNKIAWVVPTTPNVSNNQSISLPFENLEDMFERARENNVSDDRRWEEKVRLCNPIEIYDIEKKLEVVCGRVDAQANGCFIDDKTSMFYRRAGYKLILAKDAYCFHFGSVTIGDELSNGRMAKFYTKGRIECLKEYGMDPWGYGHVHDVELFKWLKINKCEEVNILAINSGLGSNILKLKSELKEKVDNRNVWITSITQARMNKEDLEGISDEVIQIDDWSMFQKESPKLYDYILIENGINEENAEVVRAICKWKKKDGIVLIRTNDAGVKNNLPYFDNIEEIVTKSGDHWISL